MKMVGTSEDGERIQVEVTLAELVDLRAALEEYEQELVGYVDMALTSPNHADAEAVRRQLAQVKETRKSLEALHDQMVNPATMPF